MTKRARFLIVATTMLAALLIGTYVQRRADQRTGSKGRPDTSVGVEGRVPIDPHGRAAEAPGDEPLRIEAKKTAATASGWTIEVEARSSLDLAPVEVQVSRFDADGAVEPAWRQVIWTGGLTAGQAARFDVQMPLGAAEPTRVQVTARHAGDAARRISTTAIVR